MKIRKKFVQYMKELSDGSNNDNLHSHSRLIDGFRRYNLDEYHEYRYDNIKIHTKYNDKSEFYSPLLIGDSSTQLKFALKSKPNYGNIYFENGSGVDAILNSGTNLVFYYQANINPNSTVYLNMTTASDRALGYHGNILINSIVLSCYSSGGVVESPKPVILRNGSSIIASIYVPGSYNSYFTTKTTPNLLLNSPRFSAYAAPAVGANGPTISQVVFVVNFTIAAS